MLLSKKGNVLLVVLFNCLFINVNAQTGEAQLSLHVIDNDSIPLPQVHVSAQPNKQVVTNDKGLAEMRLPAANYVLKLQHPHFRTKEVTVRLLNNQQLTVMLEANQIALQEVVFTAKEDKGLTSKSVINRKAMEHLQPSSFSDLMELIPGGLAKDPSLTSSNRVFLRENSNVPLAGYATSSLGVQFMVDDHILNSNSDFQRSLNNSQLGQAAQYRTNVTTGVDMRSISTNDIEKVEIIRGIPSAGYGDLTSGLIKIERKIGHSPLQSRLKVDGFSKQYYLGKGFKLKENWHLNASFDFLDAKSDPSDDTQNYQRITASLRSKVILPLWGNSLDWRTNIDFTGTLDQTTVDPDTGYAPIDRYKSYNRKIGFSNNFVYHLPKTSVFNQIRLNTSVRQGYDRIQQVQFVQYSGPRALSLSTQAGENRGIYAKPSFIAEYMTDGKPLDMNAQLQADGKKSIFGVVNHYEVGMDWRYSKNNGLGDVFDLSQPPSPTMTTRPRAFKAIPATQTLAAFIGDRLQYKINKHAFTFYGGLRFNTLLGIDKSYAISNKVFVEPRMNFQYGLPQWMINNKPFQVDVTVGYGEFYKQPTNYYLYPDKQYRDYAQLNHYHNDEQYRYVNYLTYVQPLENKNLTAAKNIKKEIRVDFSYNRHEFSVTYFDEKMNNGFRAVNQYNIYHYKSYDPTKVDLTTWGPQGPDLTNVPYKEVQLHSAYSKTENGSVTHKKGVEFQYSSPRFEAINTRLTLSGAWFETEYFNSVPIEEVPPGSFGGLVSYPYVGIYKDDKGYKNSNLNYNMMVDTYLPSLDLTISASVQGSIFTQSQRNQIERDPIAYRDLNGDTYAFTEADRTDIYKQWLVRNTSSTDALMDKVSYTINVNLKVTKSIYKSLKASMFVNRLFNYANPYYFNGIKVEPKNGLAPYFGMEMNYNF